MSFVATNSVNVTRAATFVPKLWSNETAATYEGKTVMANLVKKVAFKGKKGDTMNIPVPLRAEASAKAASTVVTLIGTTDGNVQLLVNQHFEYSKLFEDIAEVQALSSLRSFYTDDAGYAMAKRVDRELHKVGFLMNGGVITAGNLGSRAVSGADGSTLFVGTTATAGALTDAGLRRMIQTLEDNDVDVAALVIPPVEARTLRGIARFSEQAFYGSADTIKTGRIGNLYGVEVMVSSQTPWVHADATTATLRAVNFAGTSLASTTTTAATNEFHATTGAVTFGATVNRFRAGVLLSRDSMALALQQDVRTQAQYKQEYLGTLVTSDVIFGTAELRDYGSMLFVVPSGV